MNKNCLIKDREKREGKKGRKNLWLRQVNVKIESKKKARIKGNKSRFSLFMLEISFVL